MSAIADISGTLSSGRPIMLAWSGGAASTVPALSTSTAVMPGPAAEIAHDLRHPVEIDAGDDDGIRVAVDGGDRIGRHHDRLLLDLAEQISR